MTPSSSQHVDTACPACRQQGLEMRTSSLDIPYFHEAVQTMLHCARCGFRHNDFMVTSEAEPIRYRVPISGDTLGARVVRGTSGTWRIPEVGFLAEPSARSEAFVTNVEGMLERARSVVRTALNFHGDDPTKKARAEEVLEVLAAALEGEEELTLIVEDPTGNSLIIHDDADREVLDPEEAERLATGFVVFENV